MKIIVIGKSARIRGEIVRRLAEQGHEAAAPQPIRRFAALPAPAPRDPGHAGRHLRQLLERAGAGLADLWRIGRNRGRQGLPPTWRLEDGSS